MKKYFVVSDVHGFYDELISALDSAGFDPKNKDHVFVCCGDYFDRGEQPLQLMQYILSLPNKILIRGNHEDLMEDMLNRGIAENHDVLNGTYKTVQQLCQYVSKEDEWLDDDHTWKKSNWTKVSELIQPLYDNLVDYYETKNYVFVHGFIPYQDDWRNGYWEDARWLNGIKYAHDGFNITGKTIVCGHYHCSYGWANYVDDEEYSEFPPIDDMEYVKKCFEPYYDKQLIAIDACTAYTGIINIVVLEDEEIG